MGVSGSGMQNTKLRRYITAVFSLDSKPEIIHRKHVHRLAGYNRNPGIFVSIRIIIINGNYGDCQFSVTQRIKTLHFCR